MRLLRMLLPLAAAILVGALLVRSFRTGRAHEQGAEEPEQPPARLALAGDASVIRLDTAEARRAGIATVPAEKVQAAPTVELTGRLAADPGAVTTVRAPITGLLAADRWPSLGERLAPGATVGQVGDARPIVLAHGGVVTEFGARPGEVVQAGQALLTLQEGGAALADIVWTEDVAAPERLTILPLGQAAGGVPAGLLGFAPEADPATGRPVARYRLARPLPRAGIGAPVVTRLATGPARDGVLVPRAAAVQWEGLLWAFVERSPGDFARVRVPSELPLADGWAVREGIAPGDALVVHGAQQLLSEEFRAEARVGEEVGE